MKATKKKMNRKVALLVIVALLSGILPLGTPTASQAASSAPAEKSTRAGYGLNSPRTNDNGVVTWDCVWFGNYWQEDTNGDGKADENDAKTPIKWRVLSVDGDDAFLLADKNIDVQRYNKNYVDVTWETCTMRSWLNGYGAEANQPGEDFGTNNFLNNAFSKSEQSAIRTTNVVNDDNPEYGTEGGNDTSDKVYLLSIDEVTNPAYGFSSDYRKDDEARKAKNTKYVADGGEIKSGGMNSAGSADWWLRSPGIGRSNASGVGDDGRVYQSGYSVDLDDEVARAALHINLSSTSSWSYAGTVISNGGDAETVTPTPTAGATPTNKPDTPPTVTPGATMKPTITPSVTTSPDATPTASPVSAATAVPTSVPGMTSTASPTTAPGTADIGTISSVKLKQKKQAVTISWEKVSGAAGYQICYSTSKKWKGKKQKLARNNKLTVKKLKKKKTYYFRVRAYRINGTGKLYGAWSKTKKITIKK